MVAIDIRDVPQALVAAVEEDARGAGLSVTSRILDILCSRYGLVCEQTYYPYTAGGASNHWNLRVPERLRNTLKAHATATGNTMTGCVLLTIAHHYGLPPVSARKRVEPVLTDEQVVEARAQHDGGMSLRALAAEYGVTRKALTRAIRET